MKVQAWFHKTLRSGRYRVGEQLFLVGADGALSPTPIAGSDTDRRLHLNPNVERREVDPPAAAPAPPAPGPSVPTLVSAEAPPPPAGKAWFHKALRGGRYNVGGFAFHVTAAGRLVPDPPASMADRLTANANLIYRDVQPGEEAVYPAEPVRAQPQAPAAPATPPTDATFDADVGDFEQMRQANAAAQQQAQNALSQEPSPEDESLPVDDDAGAEAPVDKPKSKRGANLAALNARRATAAVQE